MFDVRHAKMRTIAFEHLPILCIGVRMHAAIDGIDAMKFAAPLAGKTMGRQEDSR